MTSHQSILPEWFTLPPVQALIHQFCESGIAFRFVGGCVRDSLLERPVYDIDICTPALPETILDVFNRYPLSQAIPTGLSHGTVTVVIDGMPFQITTLRIDRCTDGRYAEIAYTQDWREDAMRRDFTCNAIMLAPDGTLFDEIGNGIQDALTGRIRFIGDPSERIKEDYLRILRFFRFYATHGQIEPEYEALTACRELASHLQQLSVERIAQEMKKLLAAPNPAPALTLMQDYGILSFIFQGDVIDLKATQQLLLLEKTYGYVPDALLRLAVVHHHALEDASRWKCSKQELDYLRFLMTESPPGNLHQFRLACYRHSKGWAEALLLLHLAKGSCPWQDIDIVRLRQMKVPVFPLSGKQLLEIGIRPGKQMGEILRQLESHWIASDFMLEEKSLLAFISMND